MFQGRSYNAFAERGIIHFRNQWREFKGELLEYYIRYAIWYWRFLDFRLPHGDVGFAHSDKKIGGGIASMST